MKTLTKDIMEQNFTNEYFPLDESQIVLKNKTCNQRKENIKCDQIILDP